MADDGDDGDDRDGRDSLFSNRMNDWTSRYGDGEMKCSRSSSATIYLGSLVGRVIVRSHRARFEMRSLNT